ncbi:tRNA (adenosine(37)-N6)-threonylcarbamoyltransferase complex dimerization subunit type 1 TsaB [Bacillaceae bacterium Marseille-Q3522]|nr:tRNA (adenosine(37)-N6)-threonylcarbamoyltransferase complex dimerization subunit type 1 TsaB [Bacillaceae bacterium Marseille-Q3522]
MTILAIDTSNSPLGIALLKDNKVLGEYLTNVKKNHSIRVMPAIEKLMHDCEVTPEQLTKIVVAKGPGSYTGVRIGVTIAKTLAWTLQIPLVGISSLEVAASTGRYFHGFIVPFFDARRGQIYTGLYEFKKGDLHVICEDTLVQCEEWASFLTKKNRPILLVGNDLPLHRETFAKVLGEDVTYASVTELNPRPAELALLGKEKPGEEIHSFVPNYIRLAEAEAKWLAANKKGM